MNLHTPQQDAGTVGSVPEEVLAAAGCMISHFALLERGMVDFAHGLLGVPDNVARKVTAEMSFQAVRHLVASLVDEVAPDCVASLNKLLRQIERAEARKDAVLQCLWGYSRQASSGEKKAGRGSKLSVNALTDSGLRETVADIAGIMRGLERLRLDIARVNKRTQDRTSIG